MRLEKPVSLDIANLKWFDDKAKKSLLEVFEKKEVFVLERDAFIFKCLEKIYKVELKPGLWLFQRDHELYPSYKMLYTAYEFSRLEHNSQLRKDWSLYFSHPKDVWTIIIDEIDNPTLEDILLSLLHDVWEDVLSKSLTYHQAYNVLMTLFGPWIAWAVDLLTKTYSEKNRIQRDKKYYSKIMWILKNFDKIPQEFQKIVMSVIKVKLADRLHNLRDMEHMDKKFIMRKINETNQHLMKIAKRYFPQIHRLLQAQIEKLLSN